MCNEAWSAHCASLNMEMAMKRYMREHIDNKNQNKKGGNQ